MLSCEKSRTLRLGGAFEVQHVDRVAVALLLASAGVHLPLTSGEQPPWMRVTGEGGLLAISQVGGDIAIAREGRVADLDGLGFSIGGGARFGFPLGTRWSFVTQSSLRALFVAARIFPEDIGDGLTSFVLLSLSLGVELAL